MQMSVFLPLFHRVSEVRREEARAREKALADARNRHR